MFTFATSDENSVIIHITRLCFVQTCLKTTSQYCIMTLFKSVYMIQRSWKNWDYQWSQIIDILSMEQANCVERLLIRIWRHKLYNKKMQQCKLEKQSHFLRNNFEMNWSLNYIPSRTLYHTFLLFYTSNSIGQTSFHFYINMELVFLWYEKFDYTYMFSSVKKYVFLYWRQRNKYNTKFDLVTNYQHI